MEFFKIHESWKWPIIFSIHVWFFITNRETFFLPFLRWPSFGNFLFPILPMGKLKNFHHVCFLTNSLAIYVLTTWHFLCFPLDEFFFVILFFYPRHGPVSPWFMLGTHRSELNVWYWSLVNCGYSMFTRYPTTRVQILFLTWHAGVVHHQ